MTATNPARGERVPWTAAEIATLRRIWGTMTPNEMAQQIGRSRSAVTGKAHDLGLFRKQDPAPKQAARVLPLPATTTALLMGDPLPGRSALDRRVRRVTRNGIGVSLFGATLDSEPVGTER